MNGGNTMIEIANIMNDIPNRTINKEINLGNFKMVCIWLHKLLTTFDITNEQIIKRMKSKNIEVQIGSYSLHMHKAFQNNPLIEIKGNIHNSKWCYKHALALPLYNELNYDLQELIISNLKECLKS